MFREMAVALSIIAFTLFAAGCVNQAFGEQSTANISATTTSVPGTTTEIHDSASGTVKRTLANVVDVVLHRRG